MLFVTQEMIFWQMWTSSSLKKMKNTINREPIISIEYNEKEFWDHSKSKSLSTQRESIILRRTTRVILETNTFKDFLMLKSTCLANWFETRKQSFGSNQKN
jgi:hypothetical protein